MNTFSYEKMAQILIHYSLGAKPGHHVWLTGDQGGAPLYDALYRECIMAGTEVTALFTNQLWEEIFYTMGSDVQLSNVNPTVRYLTETVDRRVRIIAPTNARALSRMDPAKMALASKARAPILAKTMERAAAGDLGWVVSICPTEALAQEANMGVEQYSQFIHRAAFLDQTDPIAAWKHQEQRQARLIDFLSSKTKLRFRTSEGTDLEVNVSGMTWLNSCGRRNFPDGEVFTGPNLSVPDGGINGTVHYTYPAILHHNLVEDVRLVFEKGKVVSATASKNESFLKAMIHQDSGASTLGEIAIGMNDRIDTFTHNILLDEKIGGTFHAALGMGYPETGNKNQSALHWDMICDLRQGGTISADDQVIFSAGAWLIPGLKE